MGLCDASGERKISHNTWPYKWQEDEYIAKKLNISDTRYQEIKIDLQKDMLYYITQ